MVQRKHRPRTGTYRIDTVLRTGCMDIFLEVRVSNIPALGLYRKLGFEVLSVRKSYYSEPVEDAYVMGCQKEKYKWAVK